MKKFRIVKESYLWREEYCDFYYVDEKVYLFGIPLWWYRHLEDRGYFSMPLTFNREDKAMKYIKKYIETLKNNEKKKNKREVIKIITVDNEYNIKEN